VHHSVHHSGDHSGLVRAAPPLPLERAAVFADRVKGCALFPDSCAPPHPALSVALPQGGRGDCATSVRARGSLYPCWRGFAFRANRSRGLISRQRYCATRGILVHGEVSEARSLLFGCFLFAIRPHPPFILLCSFFFFRKMTRVASRAHPAADFVTADWLEFEDPNGFDAVSQSPL